MKAKSGNSAELNFLLLAFLRAAGINAQPMVLSTREHGKIASDYPFQTYFNYVLVLVEEEDNQLSLDATMPLLAYNELPEHCINVTGLVVAKNAEKWVEISQDGLVYTEKEFTVRFSGDLQTQKTNVHYSSFTYDAFHYRKIYYGEDKNLKEFLEKRGINTVENLRVEHYDDSEKPFNFSFDTESEVNNVSGKLFIAPFLTLAPQNNIFKQTSRRTLPVDMVLRDGGVYKAHIEIPKGYKVESAPKDYNNDGRIVSLHYKTEIRNDTILVEAGYSFKKSIYEAKEYYALQQTYNEIIRIFNSMIVLVKSDNISAFPIK
jgi:hypothetical protein